jgi:hypothetical protein
VLHSPVVLGLDDLGLHYADAIRVKKRSSYLDVHNSTIRHSVRNDQRPVEALVSVLHSCERRIYRPRKIKDPVFLPRQAAMLENYR